MDFFAHQDAARRASRRLIWIMILAVIAVVAAVDVAFLAVFRLGPFVDADLFGPEGPLPQDVTPVLLWVSLGSLLVIGGGALLSWFSLRGGGRAVAESLGGRELLHTAGDADGQRMLNIVEEMSIASGVPRPPVFVINDDGINAFAAGFRPADAAIGVTRGLMRLPRDEAQGVIAHEYSHILNGDMRLNMRLIAAVAGLLAVAGIGRVVLRSAMYSGARSSSRKKGGSPLPLIIFGALLFLIGIAGWFIGRWIQAAFSRRREYLADASAVQFTRNPDGIAGALKRISAGGSGVAATQASDMAHLFFADALTSRLTSLFATHPPLHDRIARIEGLPIPASTPSHGEAAAAGGAAMGFAAVRPAQVVNLAGAVSPDRLRLGAVLLERLPDILTDAAREPVSARAVSLLPMLHRSPTHADAQIALIHARDPWLAAEVRRLQPAWAGLEADRARWPLLQLASPALAALSPRQQATHLALADALAAEDGVVSLREFCVLRALRSTLGARRPAQSRTRLRDNPDACRTVLGAIALAAGTDSTTQDTAYATGWSRLAIAGPMPARPDAAACGPAILDPALDRLAALDSAGLRAVIDACAHAVAADGTVQPREAELLRLVAGQLGVPIPAFLDEAG
jgi:Zn-dependent protease with chaperone function